MIKKTCHFKYSSTLLWNTEHVLCIRKSTHCYSSQNSLQIFYNSCLSFSTSLIWLYSAISGHIRLLIRKQRPYKGTLIHHWLVLCFGTRWFKFWLFVSSLKNSKEQMTRVLLILDGKPLALSVECRNHFVNDSFEHICLSCVSFLPKLCFRKLWLFP